MASLRKEKVSDIVLRTMQRNSNVQLETMASLITNQLLMDGWLRVSNRTPGTYDASEMPDTEFAATIKFSGELFETVIKREVSRILASMFAGA